MKIYIFEDKRIEADKAKAAVEAASHEAIVVEGVLRLGMSDEEVIATAVYEVEPDRPLEIERIPIHYSTPSDGKPRPKFELSPDAFELRKDRKYYSNPMNILHEDTRKSVDGINRALDEVVSLKERGEDVGIITDMMFRFRAGLPDDSAEGELTPSGLLVMAHAVAHGIPCCICTDCSGDPHGRHGHIVGFIRDGYLQGELRHNPIFGFVYYKNWEAAVKSLERRARGGE